MTWPGSGSPKVGMTKRASDVERTSPRRRSSITCRPGAARSSAWAANSEASIQEKDNEFWKAFSKVHVVPAPVDIGRLKQDFVRVATDLNRKKIDLVTLEDPAPLMGRCEGPVTMPNGPRSDSGCRNVPPKKMASRGKIILISERMTLQDAQEARFRASAEERSGRRAGDDARSDPGLGRAADGPAGLPEDDDGRHRPGSGHRPAYDLLALPQQGGDGAGDDRPDRRPAEVPVG